MMMMIIKLSSAPMAEFAGSMTMPTDQDIDGKQ